MTTPLDILQAQLSAHGWERSDGLISTGLARVAPSPDGRGRCTQFIDWLGGERFRVWGGGLGSVGGDPVKASEVTAYLRERGAM